MVGLTKHELGGSHLALVNSLVGGQVPKVEPQAAKQTFEALHRAIHGGLVRACHDLSEGGLAVAAAEMAFAGGIGARISLENVPCDGQLDATTVLFSESNTRFLCEVRPGNAAAFGAALAGVPCARIGEVTASGKLQIGQRQDVILEAELAVLKEAWQKPLRW
jgi:phosphoribosylformylglycinamidine synthase